MISYDGLPQLPSCASLCFVPYRIGHNQKSYDIPYTQYDGETYLSLEHLIAMLYSHRPLPCWRNITPLSDFARVKKISVSPCMVRLGASRSVFSACQEIALRYGGKVIVTQNSKFALGLPLSSLPKSLREMYPAIATAYRDEGNKQFVRYAFYRTRELLADNCERLINAVRNHNKPCAAIDRPWSSRTRIA